MISIRSKAGRSLQALSMLSNFPAAGRVARQIAVGFLILGQSGCIEPEVNRIKDPVEKAEYHCRYVLERELATEAEKSPAGVLRRKIATFGTPRLERNGNRVRFIWEPGAIKRTNSEVLHGGDCMMDISGGGQYVLQANLDGRSLHAGFRF